MRLFPSVLLPLALLPGCAGNVADYIGPKTGIIAPELVRYGLDPAQSECVGQQVANNLTPLQLRRLARSAGAVTRGYADPNRITPADLVWVAKNQKSAKVSLEVERAIATCTARVASTSAPSPLNVRSLPAAPLPTGGPAAAGEVRSATWVNLGAASTGQSIGVDAASIEKSTGRGTAWFRLTDPGATTPSGTTYRLRIDCTARTITTMGLRKYDDAGAIQENRDLGPAGEGPLQVESGTVMEIAYLSLCT